MAQTERMDEEHGRRTREKLSYKDADASMLIIRVASGCTSRRPMRRPIIVIRKSVGEGVDVSGVGGGDRGGRVIHAWIIDSE